MSCDMTTPRGRVLCLSPVGVGAGASPALTSSIYLEWQKVTDVTPPPPAAQAPSTAAGEEEEEEPQSPLPGSSSERLEL
jgi:hypothetical protein